jgi:hypothetical protein
MSGICSITPRSDSIISLSTSSGLTYLISVHAAHCIASSEDQYNNQPKLADKDTPINRNEATWIQQSTQIGQHGHTKQPKWRHGYTNQAKSGNMDTPINQALFLGLPCR